MKIVCICDSDSAAGFRLVNISTIAVSNHQETEEAFKKVLNMPDVTVVFVTEKVVALAREQFAQICMEPEPVFIEIPSQSSE